MDAGPPAPPDAAARVDAGPRQPLDYTDDANWLCRPGMTGDECLGADLTSTEILPDGTRREVPHEVAVDPAYDCFYVYPTVALAGRIGTVSETVLEDRAPMLGPLLTQAARFTGQCRVFAPLYRQITFGTYSHRDAELHLENAYLDVAAAFAQYLSEAGDRRFVIMGHSQGSHMMERLVERVIATDPALRARMIVALLIGGEVTVPPGMTTGGSFDDVPLCTADDEVGCVVAYRTFAEGYAPPGSRTPWGCTNPARLSGGEGQFAGTYLHTTTPLEEFGVHAEWDPPVTTPFVLLADFYAGECVTIADGRSYLEVRVRPGVDDVRDNMIPFDHPLFAPGLLGMHVLDYAFPLADLMRLVQVKADAL